MKISRQYTTHLDNAGYIKKKEDVSEMLSSNKLSKNHVTPLKRDSISFKGDFNILYSKTFVNSKTYIFVKTLSIKKQFKTSQTA